MILKHRFFSTFLFISFCLIPSLDGALRTHNEKDDFESFLEVAAVKEERKKRSESIFAAVLKSPFRALTYCSKGIFDTSLFCVRKVTELTVDGVRGTVCIVKHSIDGVAYISLFVLIGGGIYCYRNCKWEKVATEDGKCLVDKVSFPLFGSFTFERTPSEWAETVKSTLSQVHDAMQETCEKGKELGEISAERFNALKKALEEKVLYPINN